MLFNTRSFMFKALMLALLWGARSTEALTLTKERELRAMARDWILNNPGAQPGDTTGALVRLGFHDAGTFDRRVGSGGAHACIMEFCSEPDACEFTAGENNGLQFVVRAIAGMYEQHQLSTVLSKADFLHLFVAVAVEISSNGGISMPFRWGRTDCAISPARLPGALPGAHWGRSKISNFFSTRLGMSENEAITLLGAHGLGRASASFSGFEGAWTTNPAILDNQFFKDIANEQLIWDRETVPSSGEKQWRIRGAAGARDTMMLDADVGMFWEVCGENPRACNFCQITHVQGSCAKFDATLQVAQTFANNNALFLGQFRTTFTKLQELGNRNLKRSCAETGDVAERLCRQGEPASQATTSNSNPSIPTEVPFDPSNPPATGTGGRNSNPSIPTEVPFDPSNPPATGTGGRHPTTVNFVTPAPATTTTTTALRVPREPNDITFLLQTLLNLLGGGPSPEPPVPAVPEASTTCPTGLVPSDVDGDGVLDCNQDPAPCNPTSCPEGSVLCGDGRGCMAAGDMDSCVAEDRLACPVGLATCGDGNCVFWEPLCGTVGVRFPAARCPAN